MKQRLVVAGAKELLALALFLLPPSIYRQYSYPLFILTLLLGTCLSSVYATAAPVAEPDAKPFVIRTFKYLNLYRNMI
jgi:hypothetical protein